MAKVAIINCGSGNLRNVQKAFLHFTEDAEIYSDRTGIDEADILVLPGVGAFGDAMENLKRRDLVGPIREAVLDKKKPILGICLGMQLLADVGAENGPVDGLGLVAGTVEKLDVDGAANWAGRRLTLPHIGWNTVLPETGSRLFRDIPNESDFYFVHGYHFVPQSEDIVAARCDYGTEFCCAIETDNIFATQFHPEKSQRFGAKLVANFLAETNSLETAA